LTREVRVPQGIAMLGGLGLIAAFGVFAAVVSKAAWPFHWASASTGEIAAGLIAAFDFGWRCERPSRHRRGG
jgi:hypothetical protein